MRQFLPQYPFCVPLAPLLPSFFHVPSFKSRSQTAPSTYGKPVCRSHGHSSRWSFEWGLSMSWNNSNWSMVAAEKSLKQFYTFLRFLALLRTWKFAFLRVDREVCYVEVRLPTCFNNRIRIPTFGARNSLQICFWCREFFLLCSWLVVLLSPFILIF